MCCTCINAFNGEMTTVIISSREWPVEKKSRLSPHPHLPTKTQSTAPNVFDDPDLVHVHILDGKLR